MQLGFGGNDEDAKRESLKEWLCIDKLSVCCHDGYYGPDCKPCQVKTEDNVICSGNGKCKGSGTRKGNGKCSCDTGYTGETCSECSQGYYNSYEGIKQMHYFNHIHTFLLLCNNLNLSHLINHKLQMETKHFVLNVTLHVKDHALEPDQSRALLAKEAT